MAILMENLKLQIISVLTQVDCVLILIHNLILLIINKKMLLLLMTQIDV